MSELLAPVHHEIAGAEVLEFKPNKPTDSPPLALFNGIGAGVNSWAKFPEALAEDRPVLVIDVSKSVNKNLLLPALMSDYKNVAKNVLDELEVSEYDAMGLSWGTLLTEELALADKKRIGKIVLAAGGSLLPPVQPPSAIGMMVLMTPFRPPALVKKFSPYIYGQKAAANPELLDELSKSRDTKFLHYLRQLQASCTAHRNSLRLPRSDVPTLIMAGDDDPLVRLFNLKYKNALTPNAELHVIKDGGHIFPQTEPVETAKTVGEFLDRDRIAKQIGSTVLKQAA